MGYTAGTIPVCHNALELSLIYDEDLNPCAVARIDELFHFSKFPNEQIKDYFYKSKPDEYTVVFFTPKGARLFNCFHCFVLNDRAWVEVEEWADRLNNIEDIQLWPAEDADWELYDSDQWAPIESDD